MKSMKREYKSELAAVPDRPKDDYPYGLCLHLDKDSLAKLGFKEALEVGTKVKIEAMAIVQSSSEHESIFNKDCSNGIQITDMNLKVSKDS